MLQSLGIRRDMAGRKGEPRFVIEIPLLKFVQLVNDK